MYDKYKSHCNNNRKHSNSIPSFKTIRTEWKPNIVRLSQSSDMCTICGRFNNLLSAHVKDGTDTFQLFSKFSMHIKDAPKARKF